MASTQSENAGPNITQIAIIAAVIVAVLVAVFTIGHSVRQNSPQVVSVMHAAPGSFGKGAWMKAHHMGMWAHSSGPATADADTVQPQHSSGASAQ